MIIFTRDKSISIDYVAGSLTLIAIVLQTIFAIASVKRAMPINNFYTYQKYFYCKTFYLATILFEYILKLIIICKANLKQTDDCKSSTMSGQIVMTLIWLAFETYFTYIVFSFYRKSRQGDYGPLGSNPNYSDHREATDTQLIFEAIPVEAQGCKLAPSNTVDVHAIKSTIPLKDNNKGGDSGKYVRMLLIIELTFLIYRKAEQKSITQRSRWSI